MSVAPTTSVTFADRVAGALLAHTAGDCLGATTEFLSPAEISDRYGRVTDIIGGGAFNWRPGQGTDDTDLSAIVVDSYVAHDGSLDLHDIGRLMLEWASSRPPDIGLTTATGLRTLSAHGDPTRSGVKDPTAAGNGSLMRAVATGIVHHDDPDARRQDAAAISAITHAAPDCIDACVAYCDLVAELLHGTNVTEAVDAVLSARQFTSNVTSALTVGRDGLDEHLGTSGWVIDSLTIAVAGLVTAEVDGAEHVIIDIANRGNDADTNAAIAGGLLGARHGIAAIPQRWLSKLEQRQRLTVAARVLAEIATR